MRAGGGGISVTVAEFHPAGKHTHSAHLSEAYKAPQADYVESRPERERERERERPRERERERESAAETKAVVRKRSSESGRPLN